jgi:hypothetical protein
LAVFVELQPVLQISEELVRRSQPRVFRGRQMLLVAQPRKREQRAAVPHPGFATTVQALQALHQEFDVPDSAFGEFDVNA